jgi:hypothetical protein
MCLIVVYCVAKNLKQRSKHSDNAQQLWQLRNFEVLVESSIRCRLKTSKICAPRSIILISEAIRGKSAAAAVRKINRNRTRHQL